MEIAFEITLRESDRREPLRPIRQCRSVFALHGLLSAHARLNR